MCSMKKLMVIEGGLTTGFGGFYQTVLSMDENIGKTTAEPSNEY